jgi:hypothetical protein
LRIRGLSPAIIAQLLARRAKVQPKHVFICVADHYEPMWHRPADAIQMGRVDRWAEGFPKMAAGIFDSRGRPPQHTFFYPLDEYKPEHHQPIADLCQAGYGDIEIHLHHDNDTAEGTREKLATFSETLDSQHGMLRRDEHGQLRYAFIHGNWALDNSRPDGRWCGVNNELTVLMETGCYADMTMPSAPAHCQTSTINSIYYAQDDPLRPKSHDRGTVAKVGSQPPRDSLLMIQGPLALDWSRRKWGVLPGIENGDLTGRMPPSVRRLELWLQAAVRVGGRDDWSFIKLHTHGAQEANAAMLLGEPMTAFHQALSKYAAIRDFEYYYVTAFEMAQFVRQAEQGLQTPDFSFGKFSASEAGTAPPATGIGGAK